MTQQKVFNTVARALLKQGKKSLLPAGPERRRRVTAWGQENLCALRGKDGLKCAIGHLIPDARYSLDLESCSLDSEELMRALGPVLTEDVDLSFLGDLQHIHDAYPVRSWRKELKLFAVREGLDTKVLDT